MSIIAEAMHRLVGTLIEARRISFMPVFAKAADHDYSNLVELIKPIVNLMLPMIANELGDDFYSKYNDAGSVDSIANQVETSLNSLKSISPDVQDKLSELSNMVCNG